MDAWRYGIYLLVFTLDISLIRCAHSFDIDVNTRRLIPYLRATMYYSLFINPLSLPDSVMVWVELRLVSKGGQGSWISPAITSITNLWLLLMERKETSNLLNSLPTYRSWLTSSSFSDSPMSWHSFDSVDKTLWCFHSNETSLVVLSHGSDVGCSSDFLTLWTKPYGVTIQMKPKSKKNHYNLTSICNHLS